MVNQEVRPGHASPRPAPSSGTQVHAVEPGLQAGLSGVATLVADQHEISEILSEIAKFAVQAVPQADGAAATLLRRCDYRPQIQTWATTAAFVEEIDSGQYEDLDEGPGISCMQSRRPALSGSVGRDHRWPHFGGRVARMGVHSVLALPLTVGEHAVGAISFYAYSRDAFTDHAVHIGSLFARAAAVSVYHARLLAGARERSERLQRAMSSRAVIDQAIGIIRCRAGLSAEGAFERLTSMSQDDNVKLHVVCERLVEEAARRARARTQP
jgi:GAF domain-containing protein